MRILVVSPRIPYPLSSGANLRIFNIFSQIAKKHEVYLLCFMKSEEELKHLSYINHIFPRIDFVLWKPEKSSILRRLIYLFSWDSAFSMKVRSPELYKRFREKLLKIVSSKKIDLIHSHTLNMAPFSYDITTVPRVLDITDCKTLMLRRKYFLNRNKLSKCQILKDRVGYYRARRYERRIMRYFDACVTVSEIDRSVFKSLSPDANISVIPNGVNTSYFRPLQDVSEDLPSLVFSGNMNFPPNVDAVLYFYNYIFPLIKDSIHNVHFYIVGSSPVEDIKQISDDKNVTVTGYVDDIRQSISKASIIICPMRLGAGIKNKILEAMSMQKPIVSTSLGAQGINVSNGEDILLADSPKEFADKVVELLNNQSLRQQIALNGRKLVERDYTWEMVGKKYEALYQRTINTYKGLLTIL